MFLLENDTPKCFMYLHNDFYDDSQIKSYLQNKFHIMVIVEIGKSLLIKSVGFKELSYTCIKSIKIKRCIKCFGNIIFINLSTIRILFFN